MVSWSSIQSLLFLIGPLVLPKAIAYYRSITSPHNAHNKNRPTTRRTPPYISLALLLLSTILSLLSTLPLFTPPNIFLQTSSRLHTSTNVLYTRLSALRPLTPHDELLLREIFPKGALEARLLYARYGPEVLVLNPMSPPGEIDAERDAMIFALVGIAGWHVLHLVGLGVVTSKVVYGGNGSGSGAAAAAARWWRNIAIMMSLGLFVAEMYTVVMYDDTPNQRSVRVSDVDFLYWKLRVYRGVAMAVMDAVLGVGMWLEATGRVSLMNAAAPSSSERVLDFAQRLEGVLVKARGVGVIRNGSVRDREMRRVVDDYWFKEDEVMKDVMEQPEVLEAQRNALRRLDPLAAARDAERFLEYVLGMSSSSSSTQPAATS